MNRLVAVLLVVFGGSSVSRAQTAASELARWEKPASNVTIIRDDWGIAHVYGKTDADAVYGVVYAQAEDDFNRVETNFINSQGRLAEAEGESAMYRDLRVKLFIDPVDMKARTSDPAPMRATPGITTAVGRQQFGGFRGWLI